MLGAAAAAWAVCLVQRWDDVYDCTTARLHDCKLRLQQLRQVFSTSCALCCHYCCGLLWIHAAQLCWTHKSHRRLSQPDHGRDHDLLSCTQDMYGFSSNLGNGRRLAGLPTMLSIGLLDSMQCFWNYLRPLFLQKNASSKMHARWSRRPARDSAILNSPCMGSAGEVAPHQPARTKLSCMMKQGWSNHQSRPVQHYMRNRPVTRAYWKSPSPARQAKSDHAAHARSISTLQLRRPVTLSSK